MYLAVIAFYALQAQQLLTPSFSFSHSKPCYVTLKDGKEMEATIKKIKRKKGLIEEIHVRDTITGERLKLKPSEVSFMYLPPNLFDKATKASEFLSNSQKWNNEKLNQDFLNQGMIYFENSKVKIKKKEKELLMQLLNPTFSKEVKVYHDPFAKETMSFGVAGVDVVGGNAKSYFISVDGKPAYKVLKKKYKKEYPKLWGSCSSMVTAPDIRWSNLVDDVIAYTECKK